eukprot:8830686-Pyramimonas_sp.AAC.1
MAQCHGHLLHITSLEAIKEPILIPTRRDFPAEHAGHIPHWLRQRRGGDAPSAKTDQAPVFYPFRERTSDSGNLASWSCPIFLGSCRDA